MKHRFHPEALAEFGEAAVFYDSRRKSLGAEFTDEVEMAVKKILKQPDRWRYLEKPVRRCLTRRFPYGVLYAEEPGGILIVAVMHLRREPGYWRARLNELS
jgi:toxin ParE1/3/4